MQRHEFLHWNRNIATPLSFYTKKHFSAVKRKNAVSDSLKILHRNKVVRARTRKTSVTGLGRLILGVIQH